MLEASSILVEQLGKIFELHKSEAVLSCFFESLITDQLFGEVKHKQSWYQGCWDNICCFVVQNNSEYNRWQNQTLKSLSLSGSICCSKVSDRFCVDAAAVKPQIAYAKVTLYHPKVPHLDSDYGPLCIYFPQKYVGCQFFIFHALFHWDDPDASELKAVQLFLPSWILFAEKERKNPCIFTN